MYRYKMKYAKPSTKGLQTTLIKENLILEKNIFPSGFIKIDAVWLHSLLYHMYIVLDFF